MAMAGGGFSRRRARRRGKSADPGERRRMRWAGRRRGEGRRAARGGEACRSGGGLAPPRVEAKEAAEEPSDEEREEEEEARQERPKSSRRGGRTSGRKAVGEGQDTGSPAAARSSGAEGFRRGTAGSASALYRSDPGERLADGCN